MVNAMNLYRKSLCALVLTSMLGTVCGHCAFAAQTAGLSTALSASNKAVVMSLDLTGPRPSVAFSINNGSPQRAIFDTGAVNTVINIEIAASLGLRNEGPLLPPFDQAHWQDGYQTTLRGAKIEGQAIPDASVPALPLPLPGFVAVISPNIFSGQLVELDFSLARLRVYQKNSRSIPRGVAYTYSAAPMSLPTIPILIGTQTLDAHLDTGSPVGIMFPMSYSKRFRLKTAMEKIGVARSHFGEQPIYRATIVGVVRVGTMILTDPEVRFTDAVPHVNVGMELLRGCKIILDPAEKRLWLKVMRQLTPKLGSNLSG